VNILLSKRQLSTTKERRFILLNYEIISTGSKGNCVIIEDIMIDIGVPFKLIKERLYDIKTILLTHIHTDHIKEATLKQIIKLFPHIKIYSNYEVVQTFDRVAFINVVNENVPFEIHSGIKVAAFKAIHDVVTYGYTFEINGESVIYCTDTSDLRNAPNKPYDYLFLESNHDVQKLLNLASARSFGYNVIAGAKRHMSTQTAKAFYYMNRRNKDSKLIELHMSSRFY
jgi:phosphoribosyl 1,2-cyclic phosphodiesterase